MDPTLAGQWAGLYTYPSYDAQKTNVKKEVSGFELQKEEQGNNVVIRGHGNDLAGSFDIVNFSNEGFANLKFNKQYRTHSWHYSGCIDSPTNIMHGQWGPFSNNTWGHFAFFLDNLYGEDVFTDAQHLDRFVGKWAGHYSTKKPGKLDKLQDCNFTLHGEITHGTGRVILSGHGESAAGNYRITGVTSRLDQVIFLTILGNSGYLYRGELGDNGLEGSWSGQGRSGSFNFYKY